jgi:hypothetical protein
VTPLSLVARNGVASLCGLAVPTVSEIVNPQIKGTYAVGEKIGPWPIFTLTDGELIAGRDNKHLDFRVSVLKERRGETTNVVISTFCTAHNVFGRVYLFFVVPFHRWGVRWLISRAILAERI